MMPRDERKRKRGIKKLFRSFYYPISGLSYAYRNEQNLAVDILMAVLVIICGFLFNVSRTEWIILILLIGLVIATELINTALEGLVDLVTEDYHPLAKVVKDTSAAAVFIFAIVSAIIGLVIFVPKFINLF